MDLNDSQDEAAFRARLRHWLTQQPPDQGQADRAAVRAFSGALHAAGFAGVTWPVEHGGAGLSAAFDAVFIEEIARAGREDHLGVIGLGMVGPAIAAFGTDAQKRHYLPRILCGDMQFCQGFSEPDAGSDLASLRTSALIGTDHVLVNGHKVWSTFAPLADHCLLLARSTPGSSGHRGLTCLLVDLNTPGVEVRPLHQLTGEERFGELLFTDVRVPLDAVLGSVGAGWRVAMTTLAHERGSFGIRLTATLTRDFDRLRALVRELGRDRDPVVRDRVASLWVEVAQLRWAALRMLGDTPGPGSSIVKLRWAETDQRIAEFAVELLADEAAVGESYRYWTQQRFRSRGSSIEGGTSEVLRDVLAERVLELPRTR